MASIIKRKKAYSVVYNYTDDNGEVKQKWETLPNHQEALKRKAEVENEINNGTFIPPTSQTVRAFLEEFVNIYGEKKWGVSMYDGSTALIRNYINPIIGDLKIQEINTRTVDKYIQTLQKTPVTKSRTRPSADGYITNKTIEKIVKLMRCAFGQAIRWEIISKNPFGNAIVPQTKYKKRDIWDAATIKKALDNCDDSKLYVSMNLAFACSLRIGEILGLTWDNVHIADEDIAADNAYVYIDKEIERATKNAIEALDSKDIIMVFQPLFPRVFNSLIPAPDLC